MVFSPPKKNMQKTANTIFQLRTPTSSPNLDGLEFGEEFPFPSKQGPDSICEHSRVTCEHSLNGWTCVLNLYKSLQPATLCNVLHNTWFFNFTDMIHTVQYGYIERNTQRLLTL